ncbi:MAG: protein kinase [Byssovorax sp.]
MSRVPLPPADSLELTLLAEIARGGMGSVELCRVDTGRLAGQIVAIKRLHPNIANDPQFVSMFLDEACITSALHHPNVVGVAAWGNDKRGMFLAIELVTGVSLQRLLKESRQNQEMFAERTVANLCSQICAGLQAAHNLRGPDGDLVGLVHRDLTPGNVLVRFDGVVKIVDFGIAKAEERIAHTQAGQLKGKPAYMSPEQARGAKIDQRSDIFSFGVMMYELLAGRRPWLAKAAFDVMMEIANEPPPNLGEVRPGLNPELVAIVHKCLEKKPEDRFFSAAEIQTRLDHWRVQKGFTGDDQQSLAAFVSRNSTAQIAWFESALRGDLAKAAAATFQELEEKIDAEREAKSQPKRKPPPLRPAAGRPADATPMPSSAAPPVVLAPAVRPPEVSMPVIAPTAVRPQSVEEQKLGLPPPRRIGDPPSGAHLAASPAPVSTPAPSSAQSPELFTGAGTAYMAISPFATGAALPAPRLPPPAAPPVSSQRPITMGPASSPASGPTSAPISTPISTPMSSGPRPVSYAGAAAQPASVPAPHMRSYGAPISSQPVSTPAAPYSPASPHSTAPSTPSPL